MPIEGSERETRVCYGESRRKAANMRKLCLAVREATGRFNDTTGMMDLPGWLKMRDLWGWPQLSIRLDCNHAHSYLKINVERWRVHGLTVISIPESFFSIRT